MGEEAEKLALIHLDGSRAPGRPDRIVASFFPAKEAPSLVVEAEARAADRAAEAARKAEQANASKHKSKKNKGKGKVKGKLPRYR